MNNSVMRYKGYTAGIRYSEEDGCLVGRILGINDIVSFHGDSVEEMRQQFIAALESYLSDCEEMGKEPDRPYSGKLMLRLTPETHKAISIEAESTGQSINDVIVAALQRTYIDDSEGKKTRRKAAGRRIARKPREIAGAEK